jgi:hypothetical protein
VKTDSKCGVVWFWTTSGAAYRIDYDEKTWHRISDRYNLRTGNGTFEQITEIVIGKSVFLGCPPIVAGAHLRIIQSTPVVRVQREEHS